MLTGTSRLILTNYAVKSSPISTTPTLMAPLPYVGNYPPENLLNPDRSVVWQCDASFGSKYVDFNLGSQRSIDCLGLHGFSSLLSFPNRMSVIAGTTYPPTEADFGAFTFGSARDAIFLLPGIYAYRYWRFGILSNVSGFTVGKFLLGKITDLGLAFSPGSEDTAVRSRVSTPMANGSVAKTEVGRPSRRLGYQFNRIPASVYSSLSQAAIKAPVSLLDPFERAFEIDLDELTATCVWGAPELYDVGFNVVTLP
jgi:hypothetical protein